jgi:hypothetical protein
MRERGGGRGKGRYKFLTESTSASYSTFCRREEREALDRLVLIGLEKPDLLLLGASIGEEA